MAINNDIPFVGEDVYLTVEFRNPDTKNLEDPEEVSLVALRANGEDIPLPPDPDFTRLQQGTWRYMLATSDLPAGRVDWRVRGRQVDGTKVRLVEDYFILQPTSF